MKLKKKEKYDFEKEDKYVFEIEMEKIGNNLFSYIFL